MEDAQPQASSQSSKAGALPSTEQQQPAAWPPPAERIKAWGDAVTAVLKALILTLAILAVGVVAVTVVWHDQHRRAITIVVDPEAEKTLRALGADLDLRTSLVDALNERVRGVQQIITDQGSAGLLGAAHSDSLSLKPFAVDPPGGDIAQLIREVLGAPPPDVVEVELMCEPLSCTASGATQGALLVTLSGASGSREDSYPIPLVNPGLRRALHQAMQQSANLLLERAAPVIASIYDVNAQAQAVFPDEKRQDLERVEGDALAARGTGKDNCAADVMIGLSLVWRGLLQDGIAAEMRAADSSDLTCQVHAKTNIVFMLSSFALCDPSPKTRKETYDLARQVQDGLSKLERSKIDNLAYYRIPTGGLDLDIVQAITELGDEKVRTAFCNGARSASPGAGADMNDRIRLILDQMLKLLPPSQSPYFVLGVLVPLRQALEVGVPREDVIGRLVTAHQMINAIDIYTQTGKHPRRLFLEQGELAIDAALAAHTALAQPSTEKQTTLKAVGIDLASTGAAPDALLQTEISQDLSTARVAFENAIVTDSTVPFEQPSDIETLTLLGDALFVIGDLPAAQDQYARAVDAFIKYDEPLNQIVLLARAAAHWASLRVASGGCRANAAPDGAWEKRWGQLGAGAHDICAIDQPKGEAGHPALFGIIRPLVTDAIKRCAQTPPATLATSAALAPEAKAREWHLDQDARFAMIDCLRSSGPDDLNLRSHFINDQTGAAVESKIENALGARL
jgi:hypothetical protein